MRKLITPLNASSPLVDANRLPSDQFRVFLLQVAESGLLIGTGSPEGVVEAEQGQIYMDDAGTAGSILYIKRDANQSGDKTLGWILI